MAADILQEILERKRQEVAAAQRDVPLELVAEQARTQAPARSLFEAATRPPGRLRVIAEVKKASPSAGLIRPDFDPVGIARAYQAAGAAAISCLTDEHYFQGRIAFIEQIRRAVPLPVLRKDFIVDAWQVHQSRAAGADAILLIAEALDPDDLVTFHGIAETLGMTTLIEIHDADRLVEVQSRLAGRPPGSFLIGVNNRDLKTMTTDLDHTFRILDQVRDPSILVSESGIRTRQDVERLEQAGVHRILVGEHLMRQEDVGAALRALMGS